MSELFLNGLSANRCPLWIHPWSFWLLSASTKSRIPYWDALIVEAALRSGATILYTEDMHPGTRYGSLELRNPFIQ